jgi:hypothetical protein
MQKSLIAFAPKINLIFPNVSCSLSEGFVRLFYHYKIKAKSLILQENRKKISFLTQIIPCFKKEILLLATLLLASKLKI